MSLDSLLASLENDVTDVTDVTASAGAAFGCNVRSNPAVTGVTPGSDGGKFVTPVTSYNAVGVTPKPAWIKAVTPVTCVTAENNNTQNKARERAPTDQAREDRRTRVLAMLAEYPNIRRPVVVDNADSDPVLVAVGIRDLATFELAIPAAKFDAFALLALIERYGATVH
jgi:hypothetical protein